ncbi:MAG: carbon storage regulator, partial [Planctomycetales bacterium]|nr:carbon storage regulator [Planctomycetales bacterium]
MEDRAMLVLGRKENESILIGENIRVTIIGRSGSSIKIGIDAPGNVK